MKPFNVKLTADERERLDAHRAALGMKSAADVLRFFINAAIAKTDTIVHDGHPSPAGSPRGDFFVSEH